MRYRLRTLLILLAVGLVVLAGVYYLAGIVWVSLSFWPEHY
jgi:hypothetical protein